MLIPETPFPAVGSYALLIDPDAPWPQPSELVRILHRRGDYVMISFPLRDGAGGNKVVALAELIDASQLTGEEQRAFHDLDRALAGRDPRNFSKAQRARKARRDALHQRIVMGPVLDRLLRFARARAEQQRRAA